MKKRQKIRVVLLSAILLSSALAGCSPKRKIGEIPDAPCLIDLHLHVDGSMSAETAIRLAQMQSITLPTTDKAELEKLLSVSENCRDLNEYLEKFDLPCSLLQTKEALSEMVYCLQEELKSAGVIYAELRFAPQKHTSNGLSQDEVVQAAIEGLNRSDLNANLILCCMRGDGLEEANLETVRLADKYRNQGVVAVDLAGAEALYPTDSFAEIFVLAKELDLNITIHAGEADGPESVKTALSFGANRIGHGVHSAEDKALMNQLKENGVPLELCLTSNLQTKAVDKLENYPLRTLMEHGVIVTLNTDNPVVSGTNIRHELKLAIDSFRLTNDELYQIITNSARASFASDEMKKTLYERIDNAFGK